MSQPLKQNLILLGVAGVVLGGLFGISSLSPNSKTTTASADSVVAVTGHAWNDNIGYISFSGNIDSGSCTPETNTAFCTRLGKTCGSVTANDNCNVSRTVASCGTCTSPNSCNASNTCGCIVTSYTPALDTFCGSKSVVTNCNTTETKTGTLPCTGSQTCSNNVCVVSTYTITFDNNGGAGVSPLTKTATAGGNIGTLPTAPTRTGYTFAGWNTLAAGTGTTFNATTAVSANLTVYAQWIGPCNFESSVTFAYNGSSVTYGTIESGGYCWLDRNLGASRVATSHTDSQAYGDYFQWGRLADGHQLLNSLTRTKSSSDVPGNSSFIRHKYDSDDYDDYDDTSMDWRNPHNENLWQSNTGNINNPCPNGWGVPSVLEISASSVVNTGNLFASIKLPRAGKVDIYGVKQEQGLVGYYWLSNVCGSNWWSDTLKMGSGATLVGYCGRDASRKIEGHSIRCVKK